MACYVALIVRTKPHWPTVFRGYVPSSTIVEPEALYTGVGIIGAVVRSLWQGYPDSAAKPYSCADDFPPPLHGL